MEFRARIKGLWLRTLRRRSQKDQTSWERITKLADDFLPQPRILHPWPNQRFAVTHPRWAPYALCGVDIYVASGSPGNLQRGKRDFERHITRTATCAIAGTGHGSAFQIDFQGRVHIGLCLGIYGQSRSPHRYPLRRGDTAESASIHRLVMWRSKPSSRHQKGPKGPEAT